MNPKALSPNVSSSPQLTTEDVAAAEASGFRAIIGNRPDGEEAGQPSWAEIAEAARAAGIEAEHHPVASAAAVSDADVKAFGEALERLPKPILCYCRTGTRSTILWALSNDGSLTAEERIRTAARAGTDLEPFRERMGN